MKHKLLQQNWRWYKVVSLEPSSVQPAAAECIAAAPPRTAGSCCSCPSAGHLLWVAAPRRSNHRWSQWARWRRSAASFRPTEIFAPAARPGRSPPFARRSGINLKKKKQKYKYLHLKKLYFKKRGVKVKIYVLRSVCTAVSAAATGGRQSSDRPLLSTRSPSGGQILSRPLYVNLPYEDVKSQVRHFP